VGGAEFGHISLDRQLRLKAEVLDEQLRRLGGTGQPPAGWSGAVEAVGEAADGGTGLGWRTRASFSVTPSGKLGMHAHRSTQVLPVREMPLATDAINALQLWNIDLQGIERVEVAAPANGSRPLVLLAPAEGTKPKRLAAVAAALPDDVSAAGFDPVTGEVTR
jgi:hypothetical protein